MTRPAKKYRRTVGIQPEVGQEAHKKLRALCDENNISLRFLSTQILEWASEKNTDELLGLGVQIPVMPNRR